MHQLLLPVFLLCLFGCVCTCDRAPDVPPVQIDVIARAPLTELRYEVLPTGVFHERDTVNLFRIDPLAPYKPGPTNYPVIYLKNGDIAIATNAANNRYRVFGWSGDSLTGGKETAIFAVKHQQVRGPARMPQKVLLPKDKTTVYAMSFDKVGIQLGLGVVDVAGGATGIWQSATLLAGDGGPDTQIMLGNWGLGTGLGHPTPTTPLRLHNDDFDRDGDRETLLTRVWNGQEYALVESAVLKGQLPYLSAETDLAVTPVFDLLPPARVPYKTVTTLQHLLITRQNGDNWRLDTLPEATQITTLNTALTTNYGIFLGGNKGEVADYAGPRNAAALQLLRPDGTVRFIDLGNARNAQEVQQLVALDERSILVVVAGGEHFVVRFSETTG